MDLMEVIDMVNQDDDEETALAFTVNVLFNNEVEDDVEEDEVDIDIEDLDPPEKNENVDRENQKLVIVVGHHLVETGRLIYLRTLVNVCLLFAIWILANPDSFRSTAQLFCTAKSNIHFHYVTIIECLRELGSRYIRWPNQRERDVIKYEFERRYGYPGVIGCIDETNITVTAPLQQKRRYVNRHHSYSVIAQAVCDHKMVFRDLFVGQPGSVGDARTFDRSPLSRNLLRGAPLISEDEHLLGDGGYARMNQGIIFDPPDPVAPGAMDESRLQGDMKREIIADLLEPDEDPQPNQGAQPEDPEEDVEQEE